MIMVGARIVSHGHHDVGRSRRARHAVSVTFGRAEGDALSVLVLASASARIAASSIRIAESCYMTVPYVGLRAKLNVRSRRRSLPSAYTLAE